MNNYLPFFVDMFKLHGFLVVQIDCGVVSYCHEFWQLWMEGSTQCLPLLTQLLNHIALLIIPEDDFSISI